VLKRSRTLIYKPKEWRIMRKRPLFYRACVICPELQTDKVHAQSQT